MTAADLIELLEGVDPDTEVRIAEQPSWPFEYDISGVVEAKLGADREENANLERAQEILDADDATPEERAQAYRIIDTASTSVLYIVEGTQLAYLPSMASRAIGWR
ncbi:MAG: hypothetical protein GXX83_00050 [Gaiellales bacterium]|nr:hypothetical protein [Gaiellales bacterium]